MAKSRKSKNKPKILEHVNDSDDEEIDEDEAFNSEDERKYGSFFSQKGSVPTTRDGSESESDGDSGNESESFDSEVDSESDDGGDYMLSLLEKLDAKPETTKKDRNVSTLVKESEFAASVLKAEKLTLDDLMSGLENTQGFGLMQKAFKDIAKGKVTSAPVSKVVSKRAMRKVSYKKSTDDVTGWIDVVQENRQAETLDFRPKERPDILAKNQLIEKFQPITDFEKELAAVLEAAGQQDENTIRRMEEEMLKAEDLEGSNLTYEEYKKRRSQLAKMRSLMFFYEQKRHHINKIKSKKYRRIRKKQRERLMDSTLSSQMEEDPDLVRQLQEKEELDRMQERMTLAHKNTSKWAKHVLKRGKNVDMETRKALSAQLARGDALRSKMKSTMADERESDDDSDGEDLIACAQKILSDTNNDSEIMKSTGLFQLSFMKKGIEAQRERAKQEARQLLQELEESDDERQTDDEVPDKAQVSKKKRTVTSTSKVTELVEPGKMVAKDLTFGKSNTLSLNDGIDIDLGQLSSQNKKLNVTDTPKQANSEYSTTLNVKSSDSNVHNVENVSENVTMKKSIPPSIDPKGDDANPWLKASENPNKSKKKGNKAKYTGIDKRGILDIDAAISNLIDESSTKLVEQSRDKNEDLGVHKSITALSQEELVSRAFIAPTEQDVEKDFLKEKSEVQERDDPTRKKESKPSIALGWGSWTGEGAPTPKLPKFDQPTASKLPKRKRDDEKKSNVIINEKRIKNTANKFQISYIPYPYKSREEYETAMAGGLGKEWNVTSSVKNLTRPSLLTRAGKIIKPISKKVKHERPAAKF
jgi:U3 small nucleolar RNA-associated protein 14